MKFLIPLIFLILIGCTPNPNTRFTVKVGNGWSHRSYECYEYKEIEEKHWELYNKNGAVIGEFKVPDNYYILTTRNH